MKTWKGQSQRWFGRLLWSGVAVLSFAVLEATPAFATADCNPAALASLEISNVTIASATSVPSADGDVCDVKGAVATMGEGAGPGAADFELMLPDKWNGKFLFQGVGGLAGTLNSSANPADRQFFLERGYATAITDTGHLESNPHWEYTAPGQPDLPKIIDYYYRAVHEVTLATKELVKDYYHAERIQHSYFDGCSNGGKMGLMEAMRFPADYDGIISGSPWIDPVGTSLWSLKNIKALLAAFIPADKYEAVGAAILKECDKLDGVADGLIQNPAACTFHPDALVPKTLTKQQAEALKTIVRPVRDDQGKLIYPGASAGNIGQVNNSTPRGAANHLDGAPADPNSADPWAGTSAPRNWVLASEILLNLGTYGNDTDLNHSILNGNVVKTDPLQMIYTHVGQDVPDNPALLEPYFARGGKLLIYHGYDDLIISPYRTIWFYEDLAAETGGYEKLQASARLFMVPGMQHCTGGAGPNAFQTLGPLESWVEKGEAPDAIPASHSSGGAVDRSMPLCKFPEKARYNGSGDVNSASNWSCPAEDRSLLTIGPNGAQAGANAPRSKRAGPFGKLGAETAN